MKDAIRTIVGKTISGVVVKEHSASPRGQVFLLFSDNTYYEVYSVFGPISGTGGLVAGGREEVLEYLAEARVVFEAYSPKELDPLEGRGGDDRRYEPVPFRTRQLPLFAPKFRDACVQFRITEEETGRWRSEGWLTIGADALETLTEEDLMELRFVAGLARSAILARAR